MRGRSDNSKNRERHTEERMRWEEKTGEDRRGEESKMRGILGLLKCVIVYIYCMHT